MISIDIFDTAIFRDVYEPHDIFKLINDDSYFKKRKEAEIKARERNPYFNIDDIYEFLPEYDKEVEIEAEMQHTYANPAILSVYNQDPSRFIFISDMYLSSKILTKLLKKAGYVDPKVYVSCDLKACKATGELFEKVQKKIKEDIKVHYGDNYIADIEGAAKVGISPVLNPSLKDRNYNLPVVKDLLFKNYIARSLLEEQEEYKDFAALRTMAKLITPLLIQFTKWVLSKRENPNQTIHFLARDMNLPYLIAKDYLKADNINYIFVSRKSMAPVIHKSKDPLFCKKLSWIIRDDEKEELLSRSIQEVQNYLNSQNIKDGDIVVDIGYSGTAQFAIQEALGIKVKGLYMQYDKDSDLDAEMFFNRNAIKYPALVELMMSSGEDSVIGYSKDKLITLPENEKKKYYSQIISTKVMELVENLLQNEYSVFDLEQILIYIQFYCPDSFLGVFNDKVFENRERKESVINYDKIAIKHGKLRELYSRSYAPVLFLRMLKADEDIKYLAKLIE